MTDPLAWTGTRARILRVLINAGEPLWPLGVARSMGIPYGTVYSTFRALYDLGWAVGVTEERHPRRPAWVLYRLTAQGRKQTASLRTEKETS